MRTGVAESLGIDFPIFGFSHCRDVVAAVTNAGGFGVYGCGRDSPEQLEIVLSWIDKHVEGRPYGVDVIMPAFKSTSGGDEGELWEQIPQGHKEFVAGLVEKFNIPVPKSEGDASSIGSDSQRDRFNPNAGVDHSRDLLEVAFRHDIKLFAAGLGPPPADLVQKAHDKGMLVAGLGGEVKHAIKQAEAGCDIVIAVGSEGGGHVGTKASTMTLVPAAVDAVAPIPVLGAGGIGTGRQVAAALALGAEGVWTGSVWLTTIESDLDPIVKEKLLKAHAEDAVISRWRSGKTQRWLRTPWIDAWQQPDAPPPLPRALQTLLVRDAALGMFQHRVAEVMTTPAGQVMEFMNHERRVRDVVAELATGFVDAAARLSEIAGLNE